VPLFAILTLFPEALEPYLGTSILGLAQKKGLAKVLLVDFRDFTRDRHRTVDDRPYGGGPGMVLKPEPIFECVEWLERRHGRFQKLLMSPAGTPFRQSRAEGLASEERILLLAGRYEGFDARIRTQLAFEEVSLGDFVLAGGELPALAVVEAVTRLVPGVLGDERSAAEESFRAGAGLDHPQFTRPRAWRGEAVPDVLLSGDHEAIRRWRAHAAAELTSARRPDLLGSEPAAGTGEGESGTAGRRAPANGSGRPANEHEWAGHGRAGNGPHQHVARAASRAVEGEPDGSRETPCT